MLAGLPLVAVIRLNYMTKTRYSLGMVPYAKERKLWMKVVGNKISSTITLFTVHL